MKSLIILLSGILLVGFLYSSVYALEQNGVIKVPFSEKIAVIDGEWTTAEEWKDASITNMLHKDKKVVLLMKHDGEYQYIMFDALYDVTPKKQGFTSKHLATILIDTENDGGTVMQKDDFRFTFGIMYDEQGEIISTPKGFLNQISIGDPNSEKGYSSMPAPSGFKHNVSFSSKNDPYESAKHYIHEFKIPLSFFDKVDSLGFSAFYDGTVAVDDLTFPRFPDKLIPREPNEWASIFFNNASIQIPTWIKNTAKWWSEGAIGDSDFTSGIQFMIKENIISIPDLPEQTTETAEGVPDWVRNNAGWWADGLISDDDFVSGIKYLVEQGIIKV